MKRKMLQAKLEELADRLGIIIRYENLGQSRGGLCRLRNQYYIFINKKTTTTYRIEILSQSISSFDLEGIYLLPEVRAEIDKYRKLFTG